MLKYNYKYGNAFMFYICEKQKNEVLIKKWKSSDIFNILKIAL